MCNSNDANIVNISKKQFSLSKFPIPFFPPLTVRLLSESGTSVFSQLLDTHASLQVRLQSLSCMLMFSSLTNEDNRYVLSNGLTSMYSRNCKLRAAIGVWYQLLGVESLVAANIYQFALTHTSNKVYVLVLRVHTYTYCLQTTHKSPFVS